MTAPVISIHEWQAQKGTENGASEESTRVDGRYVEVICESCGFLFVRHRSRFRSGRTRFCSRSCRARDAAEAARRNRAGTFAERFWSHVDQSGGPDACWPWSGAEWGSGYGLVMREGRKNSTHRVAYTLANGEIPDRLCVCHSCDNRLCCNPAHLWLGTSVENTRDMAIKGRAVNAYGPAKKLTEDDVRQIRSLAASGRAQRGIANRFGISQAHVSVIVNRQAWAWVS